MEFGSGRGSALLAQQLRLTSVEHDPAWTQTTAGLGVPVVLAPIVDGWYSYDVVRRLVDAVGPDVIVVDGPPSAIGRRGFLRLLPALRESALSVIVFDDTNRPAEMQLAVEVAAALGVKPVTFDDGDKAFSVLVLAPQRLGYGWDEGARAVG